jgi:hypothetical protein
MRRLPPELEEHSTLLADTALLADIQRRAMRQVEQDHSLDTRFCLVNSGGAMFVRLQGPDCAPITAAGRPSTSASASASLAGGNAESDRSSHLELGVDKPYWNVHCDKAEIASWEYSGLLYLNTCGRDFTGGHFAFVDADADRLVTPKAGRLVSFRSGFENIHQVRPISTGVRFALVLFFGIVENHPECGMKSK